MILAIPHYWEMLIPKVDADTEVLKGQPVERHSDTSFSLGLHICTDAFSHPFPTSFPVQKKSMLLVNDLISFFFLHHLTFNT